MIPLQYQIHQSNRLQLNGLQLAARSRSLNLPRMQPGREAEIVQSSRATIPDCILFSKYFTPTTTPERVVTNICNLELEVCLPCIAKSVTADLNSIKADQLECPSSPQSFGYPEAKASVDPQGFARYSHRCFHLTLQDIKMD